MVMLGGSVLDFISTKGVLHWTSANYKIWVKTLFLLFNKSVLKCFSPLTKLIRFHTVAVLHYPHIKMAYLVKGERR